LTKLGGGEKPAKPGPADDKAAKEKAGSTAAPSAAAAGTIKKKDEGSFYSFLKR
jgi:hypothetical protein